MLEREHLEAFVTVADELHFGRAAQRLGVAQSAISKRLKRLEDVMGGRLLERGSRTQVRLTREGAIFLPEARAALESLKATQRIGRSVLSGVAGPLRIGYVFSGAMTGTLSRLVRRLSQRFPELDIVPTLMETPAQLEALAAGRIDVGIIRPRPDYPARLSLHDIHREGMLVAMNADHPLALRDTVTPTDLAGCTFIVPQFHEAAAFPAPGSSHRPTSSPRPAWLRQGWASSWRPSAWDASRSTILPVARLPDFRACCRSTPWPHRPAAVCCAN